MKRPSLRTALVALTEARTSDTRAHNIERILDSVMEHERNELRPYLLLLTLARTVDERLLIVQSILEVFPQEVPA